VPDNNHRDFALNDILHSGSAWRPPGYLMVIGGADRLDPDHELARLFVELVQRAEAHSSLRDIVIISTATRHPEILTAEYVSIFRKLGLDRKRVHAPIIRNSDEAHLTENVRLLSGAAGVFITGGDQYALSQALDGTPVEGAIMEAFGRGAIIAGTSAGATAMGRPMVVAGGGSGELRMGMVQMSRGMAWAGDDLIIDTHFGARGRFPRLAAAVAEHPAALGIGIDENTCLLIDSEGYCVVVGTGVVYFVDASHVLVNSARMARTGQAITVGSLRVDVLSAGSGYHLRYRRMLAMDGVSKV